MPITTFTLPTQADAQPPATFTMRPLTTTELARAAGGAAYLKLGDIKGEATSLARTGLLLPAVQKIG
ncbi:MAG TPA: hypothetical protein VGN83_25845 [Falsiroseomonas sp.]|jgi:hypothetical protein|nr:hypothetical protein [Falsiroseomonas sp.]